MEEDFANYILEEKDWIRKMEIMYYLEKKGKVFFDKSVILKTELAKLFVDVMNIKDVDKNTIITASLLCNCKKPEGFTEITKVKSYAKEGANYLKQLGFENRFCKICEEVNRYTDSNPREKESDILELVDIFGGMILDRFDRACFKPDEALLLLEYRNLKNKKNIYLEQFEQFIEDMQRVHVGLSRGIEYLARIMNTARTTKVAINNAYNSELDLKEALENMNAKKLPGVEVERVDIKINPDDIESVVIKRSSNKE